MSEREMTNQPVKTDEQRVKEAWLDAEIKPYPISRSTTAYRVVIKIGSVWKRLSNIHGTTEKAWADAASRLPKASEPACNCWHISARSRRKTSEHLDTCPCFVAALVAWNAAKASSPETGELLPNGKPNTPENALLLRWNRAAAGAGMAGSEYIDDPECVFARVRENREALMQALRASKVSSPVAEGSDDGWCSSCDEMHEVQRPTCPTCGDWLVFATDDKPEVSSLAVAGGESETHSTCSLCHKGIFRNGPNSPGEGMTANDVAERLEDLAAQMRRGDFTDSSEVLVLCRDEEIGLITFLRWGDATGLLEEAASIKRPNA